MVCLDQRIKYSYSSEFSLSFKTLLNGFVDWTINHDFTLLKMSF
jgi:hypothetical protein